MDRGCSRLGAVRVTIVKSVACRRQGHSRSAGAALLVNRDRQGTGKTYSKKLDSEKDFEEVKPGEKYDLRARKKIEK